MPSTTDISPLSITDGKISNEARIAHAKLAKATEGQVLIAQSNGKFAAKSLAGDVTLDASGNTTSNVAVSSDGTTVVRGATGATGAKGGTGDQGATGATGPAGTAGTAGTDGTNGTNGTDGSDGTDGTDGSDATVTTSAVNTAGAVMHTDVPDSDTGFVKRTGAETYDVDTSTYSTTSHAHGDIYYTETETNTLLATKSGTSHTHADATGSAAGFMPSADKTKLDGVATGATNTVAPHYTSAITAIEMMVTVGTGDSKFTDKNFTSTLKTKLDGVAATAEVNVLSDWDATTGDAVISNKPTLGGAAALAVGTTTGTVCAGDDSRLSDARTPSTHTHGLSDVTDSGGAAALDVGTATGTVCAGDDSRLTDSRTPTTHTHALSDVTDSGGAAALDVWAGVGPAAGAVCAADDGRLADTRDPNSHNHAGTDITSGTVATARLDVGASSGKVAAGDHTHSSYISGNETITLSGDVSGSGTTAITCTVDDDSHNHAIGTITGVVNTGGAGAAGKLIKLDAAGHIDSTMINDGDISYTGIADVPSTFAPSGHNHTLSDVTDSGTAAPLDVPASGNASTSQVVKGNDTRLSDARTPSAHNHAATDITSGTLDTARLDVGASSGKVAAGDHTHSGYPTIDDSSALATDVWSASKIISYLVSFYATLANGFAPHKYTAAIEWETEVSTVGFTGTSGSMVCTLNHGLGTKYVFIAVRDKDDASEDVGYVAITTVIDANNVKLEYSVSDYPDVDEDKFVTIIG